MADPAGMAAGGKKGGDEGGCLAVLVVLFVVCLVLEGLAWLVCATGHVLGLTPTLTQAQHHGGAWVRAHYDNVVWGYVLAGVAIFVGVPLSVWLSVELTRERINPGVALSLAGVLVVLALVISVASIASPPG